MPTSEHLLLERRISAERLARYRVGVHQSLPQAIELYEHTFRAAGQLWVVLGHVEVLARNVMHEQLTAWSLREFGEARWYLDAGAVFNHKTSADIAAARVRAVHTGKPESVGRVVAELGFGFWRYLLAIRYERSLWRTCLHVAFPGQGRRKAVHAKVATLHGLRNRIAHHEPIHDRPLQQWYEDALTVAGWICPSTRDWIHRQALLSPDAVDLSAPH